MNDDELAKRNEEIERGNKAKAILDSEIFQEAFDALRATYMDEWSKSKIDDGKKRELIWNLVVNLDDVKAHFVDVLATGKMSEKQLADIPSINATFEEDSKLRLRTFLGG